MTNATKPSNHKPPGPCGGAQHPKNEIPELGQTDLASGGLFPSVPVWYVNVYDASLEDLSLFVCAGRQQPVLVFRQAIGDKEVAGFLRAIAPLVGELRLGVLLWSQDERRAERTWCQHTTWYSLQATGETISYLTDWQLKDVAAIWTRTTRTPAFWGYPPPPHDYPYYGFISDPMS